MQDILTSDLRREATSSLPRDPRSVPDLVDQLVYLDSDEEEELRRERERGTTILMPNSASVRFTKEAVTTDEEEGEFSTSDYASAERVNRLSGASLGFSNPHYLGPDVRTLGMALTPDSGVAPGDIELKDMSSKRARSVPREREERLHLLLVGGREPPHVARLQGPLSMWTYRLL
ncbi:putative Kelch repeat domain [Operophtera brumata]|uniref:Putative Kelch repeat domain n=1 Tax=Operophtera brumata TaxID=104452 RepID=A0A0L7LP80_OPEBR|nr:putative Kelch repeat domain [Operophtera brumata]